MKFFKSINFQLTFWYGLVTFVSSIFVLFTVNFVYLRFVNRTIEDVLPPPIRQRFLTFEQDNMGNVLIRDILKEIRENDAKQVQRISLFAITGNLLIAITGGYFLAQQMLKPIKHINRDISEIEAKNLDKKIKRSGTNDEIDELIDNFNNMTTRLSKSFNEQGDFVANAAHELKTPMAVVMTNIETALLNPKLPKDTKLYLGNAVSTISNMNGLLEDLLLLSSLSIYQKKLATVSLNRLIEKIYSDLRPIAGEKEITLQLSLDKADPQLVCTPALISRAISNIAENAIKYAPEKTVVQIQTLITEKNVKIVIADQGPGIGEEYHDKIFQRFYRIDDSRSRKSGGTGLGLAISKEIIVLHNGTIKITKNKPKGSIFTITLPLQAD